MRKGYDDGVGEVVYLDLCCLKRPFDDAAQERVRREAGAVASLVAAAERHDLRLVRSPAHDLENERNPREDRRLATRLWLEAAAVPVASHPEALARGRALAALGFAPLDALHLAFAERANAEWFATTDDRLLARARAPGRAEGARGGPRRNSATGPRRTDMSRSSSMSLYEIRMEGWKALTERLGAAGAMRFMMQYDPGHGDYSTERHEMFADLTIDDVIESLDRSGDSRPGVR